MSSFWQFWTFKWQFSGGLDDESHFVCTESDLAKEARNHFCHTHDKQCKNYILILHKSLSLYGLT